MGCKEYTILYHVSFSPVRKFKPRIPKQRAPGEDKKTPRICFSEDIKSGITSMPDGGSALRGLMKLRPKFAPIIHVYCCCTWENKNVKLVCPEDVQEVYGVLDGKGLREWWALDVPNVTHNIFLVKNAEFKDHIDLSGKSGVLITSIDYDLVKPIPKNAPELVLNDPVIKKVGLRKCLSVYDEGHP